MRRGSDRKIASAQDSMLDCIYCEPFEDIYQYPKKNYTCYIVTFDDTNKFYILFNIPDEQYTLMNISKIIKEFYCYKKLTFYYGPNIYEYSINLISFMEKEEYNNSKFKDIFKSKNIDSINLMLTFDIKNLMHIKDIFKDCISKYVEHYHFSHICGNFSRFIFEEVSVVYEL